MWKKNLYPLAPYFILIAIRAIYNSSPKNWYRNWTHTIFPHSHVQITRQIVYKRKYGKTVLHYSTFGGNLYLSRQVFNSCGAIFEFFYFLFLISSTSLPILVRVLLSFRVDSVLLNILSTYIKYWWNYILILSRYKHLRKDSLEGEASLEINVFLRNINAVMLLNDAGEWRTQPWDAYKYVIISIIRVKQKLCIYILKPSLHAF